MDEHTCSKYDKYQVDTFDYYYGNALDPYIYQDESGNWGVGNGEYASPIGYCPWCGIKLGEK
jgi:hypothetical protein